MKIVIRMLSLSIAILFCLNAHAENEGKILVHITGYVEEPGSYSVPARMTMEGLREVCGGLTQHATSKRMMVIRFPRPEGLSEATHENPDKRKDEILRLHQIPKDGKYFLFNDGDIIYMPGKYYIGR